MSSTDRTAEDHSATESAAETANTPETAQAETGEPGSVEPEGGEAPGAQQRPKGNLLTGLIRTARPKQWVKNVLVLAAPVAAGRVAEGAVLLDALIAFLAFSLVASSVYLINDAIDVDADRAHPTKRNRPIAAGIVPVPIAYVASAVLFLVAAGVSLLAGWQLLVVIVVYEAIQLAYCFGLKHQTVVDLCIVASGFLMRAVAGGIATDIVMTQWFYLVFTFGSLFMVSGKRFAEVMLYERTGAKIRSSLKKYSASYLRFVWATAAAALIMSYSLWAFDIQQSSGSSWAVISMVPFVIAILRYAVDVDGGNAGEPEEIALRDRVLQVLGFSWVVTLALSVYL